MVTSPDFQSSSPHPPERGGVWGGLKMDFTWETPAVRPRRARPRGDTSLKSGEKEGGAASVPPQAPRGPARRFVLLGSLQAAWFWRLRNLGLSVVSSRTALVTATGITQKGWHSLLPVVPSDRAANLRLQSDLNKCHRHC